MTDKNYIAFNLFITAMILIVLAVIAKISINNRSNASVYVSDCNEIFILSDTSDSNDSLVFGDVSYFIDNYDSDSPEITFETNEGLIFGDCSHELLVVYVNPCGTVDFVYDPNNLTEAAEVFIEYIKDQQ